MSAFFIGVSIAFIALSVLMMWCSIDNIRKNGGDKMDHQMGTVGTGIIIIASMILIASVITRWLS